MSQIKPTGTQLVNLAHNTDSQKSKKFLKKGIDIRKTLWYYSNCQEDIRKTL